jgi:hypothetical protein
VFDEEMEGLDGGRKNHFSEWYVWNSRENSNGGGGVNIGSLLANPLARSQGQVKLDSDKNLFSNGDI